MHLSVNGARFGNAFILLLQMCIHGIKLSRGCSHGTWWINRPVLYERISGLVFRHDAGRTGDLSLE
jgi:hypothetical protein